MGYELNAAQKAPVLDESGNPIAADAVSGGLGTTASFAMMQPDASGNLELIGNAPGTIDFELTQTATGTASLHTVTVTPAPFDWTLGTPVAK